MKQGFTLIELSIVLVIIGLIIGGITVGQDLIRSSELRTITSDAEKYLTAVRAYQLKYNALPGDHNKASQYWPTDCVDIGASNPCDGDGDGWIEHMGTSITASSLPESGFNNHTESVRVWQHLYLAGLIPFSADGDASFCAGLITGCWAFTAEPSGLPIGKLGQRYLLYGGKRSLAIRTFLGTQVSGSRKLDGYSTTLESWMMGQIGGSTYGFPYLTGAEAYSIDDKYDDGRYISGMISGSGWSVCRDGTGYNLGETEKGCELTIVYR